VKLADSVGGFGSLLISYQDWADKAARLRSLELFARHVAPRLRNALKNIDASQEWVAGRSREFVQSNAEGRAKAMD
jgi:limonene 1,2-monooxygenase